MVLVSQAMDNGDNGDDGDGDDDVDWLQIVVDAAGYWISNIWMLSMMQKLMMMKRRRMVYGCYCVCWKVQQCHPAVVWLPLPMVSLPFVTIDE